MMLYGRNAIIDYANTQLNPTALGASARFAANACLYVGPPAHPSIDDPNIGYKITDLNKEEYPGYSNSGQSIREVAEGECSVTESLVGVSGTGSLDENDRKLEPVAKVLAQAVKIDNVLTRSYFQAPGESIPSGGGGGSGPPRILDFIVGGLWGPRYFDGETFDIENVLRAGFLPSRRPGDGKSKNPFRKRQDNSYATLFVMDINGMVMYKTSNFRLQAVAKRVGDKMRKISTQEGTTISFTCQKNNTFNFQGVFLDTPDYDWARQWYLNWDNYTRGQVTARNLCRVVIVVNEILTAGYLTRMSTNEDATMPYRETFTFSIFVTDHIMLPTLTMLDATGTLENTAGDTGDFYSDKQRRPLGELT